MKHKQTHRCQLSPETLERRRLLSAFPPPNQDISLLQGNQFSSVLAVNPASPSTEFAAAATDGAVGLLVAQSVDSGTTWTQHQIGNGTDNLPIASSSPSAIYDSAGQLLLAYVDQPGHQIDVLLSGDNGTTFSVIAAFSGRPLSDPKLVAISGGAAIAFLDGGTVAYSIATISANGQFANFSRPRAVPGSTNSSAITIADSPGNQLMVAYQQSVGEKQILSENVNIDPSSPKTDFSSKVLITTLDLPSNLTLPAEPNVSLNASPTLAFGTLVISATHTPEHTTLPYTAYVAFADATAPEALSTGIFLYYLVPGRPWEAAGGAVATGGTGGRIDDDTSNTNNRFLPNLAVDPSTGDLAVTWYDARADLGTGGADDTDLIPNDDVQLRACVIVDVVPEAYDMFISASQVISTGASNARDAENFQDFGTTTGLTFFNGILSCTWTDNSNSTGNNPNGTLRDFNINYATTTQSAFPLPATPTFYINILPNPGTVYKGTIKPPANTISISPYQVREDYGLGDTLTSFSFPKPTNSSLSAADLVGNGAGETIAIIDSSTDPDAKSDLWHFDAAFGLPNPPSFEQLNEAGGTMLPALAIKDRHNGAIEQSIDIEWAHVMAPDANIVLIEANTWGLEDDVSKAVATAENLPGVVAISMSFGFTEAAFDPAYNSLFTTPQTHPGVTFVAASGDSSVVEYPSASPNVVAVGGTLLPTADTNANEIGWEGSGHGLSTDEPKPSYQSSVLPNATTRVTPDVALTAGAEENKGASGAVNAAGLGLPVYDSYDGGKGTGWGIVNGTSIAAPMFAGLIAVADQGRALNGLPSLDGATQTLPFLYSRAGTSAFRQVPPSGTANTGAGESATLPAYEPETGLGCPTGELLDELADAQFT